MHVRGALHYLRLSFSFGERRQEHSDEYCNDANNNEQLDKCKPAPKRAGLESAMIYTKRLLPYR
jgi:hypothetical protein